MLRWKPVLIPATFDLLAPHQQKQLSLACRHYDGSTPAARLASSRNGEMATELWQLVERTTPRYDVWLLGGDSGVVFVASSVRTAGAISQFGFTAPRRSAAWREIAASAPPPADSGPSQIDFSLPE